MKGFLLGLIFGILIAGAVVWYYADQKRNPTAQAAREGIQSTASEAKGLTQERLKSLGLTSENIKEELARTGKVVRRKSEDAGTAIADATADARITTVIKGKLLADPELSALSISVNTTDGRVTLSGSASSPENIRKAILVAMDTDGVREVVSTVQVK
jgi:hyperosmotically inducible protein